MKRVHFSVTGEFVTKQARTFWHEREFAKAFDLLDCMIGMTKDQQLQQYAKVHGVDYDTMIDNFL